MKAAILIVGHSQNEEWKLNAEFFCKFPEDSLLRNAHLLAYVNSNIEASKIENYLKFFPQKIKKLFYTPINGHSVDDLPLDTDSNKYKLNYSVNSSGYTWGILEAYSSTFPLLKDYDWIIQINPDVYITDNLKIEKYLADNFENQIAFHVNTMRGNESLGFNSDFIIYRPKIMKINHFEIYKNEKFRQKILEQKFSGNLNYKHLPEKILQSIIKMSGLQYSIICPGTRNNREIDQFGIWHCHDNTLVKNKLNQL